MKNLNQFDAVDQMLIMNDLTEVKLEIRKFENDRGRMTNHLIATWPEAKKVVNQTGDGWAYELGEATKIEEVNKYFSADLFFAGIAQRKAWIKAGLIKQVEALKGGLMHPAMYKG